MTEVYEFMYSLRTLWHVPFLVRLSSRYDGRLTGVTTTPLTCERDRRRTVWCPTHVLKVLDIISTMLHHFVRSFYVLCMRHMMRMRMRIPSNDVMILYGRGVTASFSLFEMILVHHQLNVPGMEWRGLRLDLLRGRVQRLVVLMETTEPGTVPDAGMLASLIDLVGLVPVYLLIHHLGGSLSEQHTADFI